MAGMTTPRDATAPHGSANGGPDAPGEPAGADAAWSIARIADHFGITHRTVRHYESLGLIHPERHGTQRLFHRRDRTRLALVLRGRRLGFPLEEIRTIVDMYDDHPGEAGQLRYLLSQITERRADLEQRRRDVDEALAELDHLQHRCTEDLHALDASTTAPDATPRPAPGPTRAATRQPRTGG